MVGVGQTFFDANIYNHLIDYRASAVFEELSRAKDLGKLEIVTSTGVLDEILATPTTAKLAQLASCILRLTAGKLIKPWNQLMRAEIQAWLGHGQHLSPFCDLRSQQRSIGKLLRLAGGEHDMSAEFDLSLQEDYLQKRQSYQKERDYRTRYRPCLNEWATDDDFERRYRSDWEPNQQRILKKLLETEGIQNPSNKLMDNLRADMKSLPHVNAFLRLGATKTFALAKGMRPKWGDKTDLRHMICAATSNVFVSNESSLRVAFEYAYEQKSVFDLSQLIAKLN